MAILHKKDRVQGPVVRPLAVSDRGVEDGFQFRLGATRLIAVERTRNDGGGKRSELEPDESR